MMKTYLYYRGGLNDSGQYIHERSEDGIQWEVYDPEQVINFIEYGFDPAITDSSQRVTHHCPGYEAAQRELADLRARLAATIPEAIRIIEGYEDTEPMPMGKQWDDGITRIKAELRALLAETEAK